MDHKADPVRHSFLHTPECNVLWKKFVDCKTEHYVLRYLDYCEHEYNATLKCFKKERRQKAANNHKLAEKERREQLNRIVEKRLQDKN